MADTALLSLTQWLSPSFPLGSFAYSHGLETMIATGGVRDAETLRDWLTGLIAEGSGRSDAVLLASVLNGGEIEEIDALIRALAASPERLDETLAQGRAFLATLGRPGDLAFPVALGREARGLGLSTETVLAFWLQAFASNLVLIAVRAVPLGQTEGQQTLTALQPLIADIARALATATPDDLGTAAFAADIASMAHEHQETRLFRS